MKTTMEIESFGVMILIIAWIIIITRGAIMDWCVNDVNDVNKFSTNYYY